MEAVLRSCFLLLVFLPLFYTEESDIGLLPCSRERLPPDWDALQSICAGRLASICHTDDCNYCAWEGISCDANEGLRVVSLRLSSRNLAGDIPDAISGLDKLITVDLSNNTLSGYIPPNLVSLQHLHLLNLSRNSLDGRIPELPAQIKLLDLSRNRLESFASNELHNLKNLSVFDASHNRLSGEIPSTIGNWTQLEFLHLRNNNFSGSIPSSFKSLRSLRELDLSKNNLSGSIPIFFGDFPNLTLLDLSYNLFDPRNLPQNLCSIDDDSNLILKPCNRSSPNPAVREGASGRKEKVPLVVILIIVIVFVTCSICLSFLVWRHKSKVSSIMKFTYADLHAATHDFSSANFIGSGSVGSVYRGALQREKTELAVKVLCLPVSEDANRFIELCNQIRSIRHHNLLPLLAGCAFADPEKGDFRALVYHLMPRGNLEMWVHDEVISQVLSFRKWNLNLYQRLNIAIQIASALLHLHSSSIVHCNLKPTNILIADDMTAVVADVGMDRFFPSESLLHNSTGYSAPECRAGRPATPLWDVYSFGVILLEMITGKRPTKGAHLERLDLHGYVRNRLDGDLEDITDPLLMSEETGGKLTVRTQTCIRSILKIALSCSDEVPGNRAQMGTVLEALRITKDAFLQLQEVKAMEHALSQKPMLADVEWG